VSLEIRTTDTHAITLAELLLEVRCQYIHTTVRHKARCAATRTLLALTIRLGLGTQLLLWIQSRGNLACSCCTLYVISMVQPVLVTLNHCTTEHSHHSATPWLPPTAYSLQSRHVICSICHCQARSTFELYQMCRLAHVQPAMFLKAIWMDVQSAPVRQWAGMTMSALAEQRTKAGSPHPRMSNAYTSNG
jgi:hypothetical protein